MNKIPLFDEFNYTSQKFKVVLKELKHQPLLIKQSKIKNLEKSIKEVRMELLTHELRAEYPCANPDLELLELVGSEPCISLKEEKEEIKKALEKRILQETQDKN
ncbi:MAG: hypothetical protein CVT89_05550 [Candidatus Altiarchaeales archaeon HGW-Altiarchaeales-2]|nr:MAG: hypothetical protein CVT89_05550 [Candidatus Altiarchaeales archaeon HGW-Altiarchaeales-2]